MADNRPEFLHADQYQFTIDGVHTNSVLRIEGLKQDVSVTEHRHGAQRHKGLQAGRLNSGEITITVHVTGDANKILHEWRAETKYPAPGKNPRRNCSIGLVDRAGGTVGTYSFFECQAKSIGVGTLSGTSSANATMNLTFTFEKFTYA